MAVRKMNEVHDGVTCAVAATSDLIGSKWTALIVHDLSEGPRRFTELEHACPGISPRTLSERLHMLEQQGIVERQSYPESPPRVEYELTGQGQRAAADHRGDARFRARLADRRSRSRARAPRAPRSRGPVARQSAAPYSFDTAIGLGQTGSHHGLRREPDSRPAFGHVRGDHFHAPPLGGRCCSRGPGRRTRRLHNGRRASPTERKRKSRFLSRQEQGRV